MKIDLEPKPSIDKLREVLHALKDTREFGDFEEVDDTIANLENYLGWYDKVQFVQPRVYSQKDVMDVIETTLRAHMPRYMDNQEVEERVLELFNNMEANQ